MRALFPFADAPKKFVNQRCETLPAKLFVAAGRGIAACGTCGVRICKEILPASSGGRGFFDGRSNRIEVRPVEAGVPTNRGNAVQWGRKGSATDESH